MAEGDSAAPPCGRSRLQKPFQVAHGESCLPDNQETRTIKTTAPGELRLVNAYPSSLIFLFKLIFEAGTVISTAQIRKLRSVSLV